MRFAFYSLPLLLSTMLAACSGEVDSKTYPLDPDDRRIMDRGRLSGDDDPMVLFGKNSVFSGDGEGGAGGYGGVVNGYLWRASLETLSFLPLQSADPSGGIIISDWYEDPETPGERYRVNVMILDSQLRSDAVRVNVFKQRQDATGGWQNIPVDNKIGSNLEETILTKARSLKIRKENS